jgi:hypothetical protein
MAKHGMDHLILIKNTIHSTSQWERTKATKAAEDGPNTEKVLIGNMRRMEDPSTTETTEV